MSDQLPTEIIPATRLLTAAEFHRLADVPPESEWFANIRNRSTRRAYENAIRDFMRFTGIVRPDEFRTVTRADVIAWRDDPARRDLGGATIRHRHAALSSLFEYLCKKTPLATTLSKASSGPRPSAAKANAGARRSSGAPAARRAQTASGTHINTVGRGAVDRLDQGDDYVFSAGSGGKHCEPTSLARTRRSSISGSCRTSSICRRATIGRISTFASSATGSSSWSAIRTARSPSRGPGADLDPS